MTFITGIVSESTIDYITLTLLHTLWQGPLVCAILWGLLRLLPPRKAHVRYGCCISALIVIVLAAFVTHAILRLPTTTLETNTEISETSFVADSIPSLTEVSVVTNSPPPIFLSWQDWLFAIWLLGTIIMLIRVVLQVHGIRKLSEKAIPIHDSDILNLVIDLKHKLGLRRDIRIAQTDRIQSPGTIGWFRPVILLPTSLLSGIPTEALQAILAHELAHICRYDYLINIAQMVIEALLFFNPAIWWLSHQIRLEREACCDVTALSLGTKAHRYAEILVEWSLQTPTKHAEVTALVGFSQNTKGTLLERIKRILHPHHRPTTARFTLLSTTTLILLCLLALLAIWKTTDTAVTVAAQILTPAERAKVIDQIDKTHGIQASQREPNTPVTLSGTVRAVDGSQLPDNFYMSILGQSTRGSISSGTRVKHGIFRHTMHQYFHTLYLVVDRLDFAPTYVGPLHLQPGEHRDDIDVVLEHGFEGTITVTDSLGNPIPEAVIDGRYEVFSNFWSGSPNLSNLITNKQGHALIPKAIERPMVLHILAQGYQYKRDLSSSVPPNQPAHIQLQVSLPTRGIILDQRTGKPIPQAALRLWRDHTGHQYAEGHGSIWATTNEEGQFTLTTLAQGQPYRFIIESPHHQFKRLKDITMGQTGLQTHLTPKHHVRGKVIGDPPIRSIYDTKTKSRQRKPVLPFYSGYEDEYSYHHGEVALIKEKDYYTFDITDTYGDILRFETGYKEIRQKIEDRDINNLIIDLRPPQQQNNLSNNLRPVILQFSPPSGCDCNNTQISVSCISQSEREAGHWGQWQVHTIQNNQIKLSIPTPGILSYHRGQYEPHFRPGKELQAFWINSQSLIPIPAGAPPYVIDINMYPAGSIYGDIHLPTNAHHSDVSIQLLIAQKPHYVEQVHGLDIQRSSYYRPSDKYTLAPIPFEGCYVIFAKCNYSWIMSDPIRIEEGQSIVKHDLTFPPGVDVTGTILSDKGRPLQHTEVSLQLSTTIGSKPWSTARHVQRADRQGQFSFPGVNPKIAGHYTLRVEGGDQYESIEKKIKPRKRPYTIKLKQKE